MYHLCGYYTTFTVKYFIANCVSWIPRLTFLDLWTDYTYGHSEWNLFMCRGLTTAFISSPPFFLSWYNLLFCFLIFFIRIFPIKFKWKAFLIFLISNKMILHSLNNIFRRFLVDVLYQVEADLLYYWAGKKCYYE